MNPVPVSQASPVRKRGIALVMVLSAVALITILVLAFFSSVTTEFASSKSYSEGASAKGLSDSAVSAVMGIIRDATSAGPKVAWSSQPGMLRTYDDAGQPLRAYKLYSSDKMTVSAFDPADDVDVAWKDKSGLYTDLNKPISVLPDTSTGSAQSPTLHYPIVDPAAADPTTGVEGFSLINAPGYDKASSTVPANNPAPMPVKWIYLLRDGTMATPDKYDTATGIATFSTEPKPTKANPIVGRMAFWTDDETAKVNINTASEGTFWDVPVCNTQPVGGTIASGYTPNPNTVYEQDLTEYQGAQKEFQRYSGHPATTCLSTVFEKSLIAMNSTFGTPAGRPKLIETITNITPRVTVYDSAGRDYSSQGGTRRSGPPGLLKESEYGGFKLQADGDRLYASVDELTFAPLTAQPDSTTKRPEQALAPSAADTKRVVEQARFFVTAQSRAPEVNLFNKPRVAIWPLQVMPDTRPAAYRPSSTSGNRTYFDKLIAFCASIGERSGSKALTPYFFTREDPTSGTKDWSTRNQEIYKYLQTLSSANVPGFGKNFSAKFTSTERDQILTEIFDYIRCTNLIDYSDPSAANAAYTPTGYTYNASLVPTPISQNVVNTKRGQVVPIAPPPGTPGAGTRGIGRIATISEMALVAIRTGPRKDGQPFAASGTTTQDDTKTDLQIALIPQLFCPMAGYSAMANNIRIRFKNISIKVNGVDAFASNPNQSGFYDLGRISNAHGTESKLGGVIGYRALLENDAGEGGSKGSKGAPSDSLPAYANITIDSSSISSTGINKTLAEANTMVISGSVDVDIEAPATSTTSPPGPVVQTMSFNFPTTTVPIPNRVFVVPSPYSNAKEPNIVSTSGGTPKRGDRISLTDFRGYNDWDQNIFFTTRLSTSTSFDVVRSVAPASNSFRGDVRLVAAKTKISSGDFVPPSAYSDPKAAGVHSLRWGATYTQTGSSYTSGPTGPPTYQGNFSNGAVFGSLLKDFPAQYCRNTSGFYLGNYVTAVPFDALYDTTPPIPEGIAGVKNSLGEPGDWDNGPALIFDGPLCNKADEGTDRHRNHSANLDSIEAADTPYLGPWAIEDTAVQYASFFSPNRMMPSPVMLGSLPTGVIRGLPWQTLLFRPAVAYLPGGEGHPGGSRGGAQIPDHLLLDLFWMPVVEPYAISEPMATAGKINLNYQIVPFSHIKRDTGLRAVLKSVKVTALNPNQTVSQSYNKNAIGKLIHDYKRGGRVGQRSNLPSSFGGGVGAKVRYNINLTETLKQFDTERFDKKRAFISASEICEIPLVPEDTGVTSAAGLPAFWAKNVLTGDNSLERPYAHLYSRLTTKSNTYTVHVWVETVSQGIPKTAAADDPKWAQWNEAKGQVAAQYRGSTLIERYIDPQDPRLASFDETYDGSTVVDANGNITKAGTLDPFYRFRVLSTKRFDR